MLGNGAKTNSLPQEVIVCCGEGRGLVKIPKTYFRRFVGIIPSTLDKEHMGSAACWREAA